MAHAITQRANGFNEMAYVGNKPWHGLGQELREGATIEEWVVAAGMDWKVQRSKVRYATGAGQGAADFAEWPDFHVLMRSDTKAPLGLVSDGFKVVQPHATLEFFRDLVEVAGFKLETAGTLHGGRKFWALASIGAEDRIVGRDLVKGKLMLATACDGTMNTIAKNVAERVVCANTLAIALGERGAPEVRVSHRSTFDAAAVKAQLGVAVGVQGGQRLGGTLGLPEPHEQHRGGQADQRQVEGARLALQHNLGLGCAAVVTLYGQA